jgi:hypothetical protein
VIYASYRWCKLGKVSAVPFKECILRKEIKTVIIDCPARKLRILIHPSRDSNPVCLLWGGVIGIPKCYKITELSANPDFIIDVNVDNLTAEPNHIIQLIY